MPRVTAAPYAATPRSVYAFRNTMVVSAEDLPEVASSKHPDPGDGWLTRAAAAKLIGATRSTIRRLEVAGALHPTIDAAGIHRFDPAEVACVARDRAARPVDSSKEGERDARAFDALDQGRSMREIVTTLRLPVELVRKLHEAWVKMGSKGDMVLSSEQLTKLRSALGIDIKRPADIAQGAQWLAEECDALQAERNNVDMQLADLVCALSKAAVHDPNVAKALPDIRKAVDPDVANRLDVALQYFAGECASSPSGPQDAAAGGDEVG